MKQYETPLVFVVRLEQDIVTESGPVKEGEARI